MDDNLILNDDPISYFKSNIQAEHENSSSTIFLDCPKHNKLSLWVFFCAFLGLYFIISMFVSNILLIPMSIEGSSMYPTLNYEYSQSGAAYSNDIVYLRKTQSVKYKDIVVFNSGPYTSSGDQIYYIKRVIATAGDTLQFVRVEENTSSGTAIYEVVKNGVQLEEDYVSGKIIYSASSTPELVANETTITIPNGYIFVMGDNRNNSKDSRELGLISTGDILGKVVIHVPYGDSVLEGIFKSIKHDYLF